MEEAQKSWQKPLPITMVEELFLFPVWWYSKGLLSVLKFIKTQLVWGFRVSAVGVWSANLFVPMYGDASLAGRAISFGLRVFMILFRGGAFLVWFFVHGLGFLVYLVILPVSIVLAFYYLLQVYVS